jgi:hypothetical protein
MGAIRFVQVSLLREMAARYYAAGVRFVRCVMPMPFAWRGNGPGAMRPPPQTGAGAKFGLGCASASVRRDDYREKSGMSFEYPGLWGTILLVLDIWAILNVVQSRSDTLKKAIWIVVILLLPLLGFIIWLLMGPRSPRKT